MTAKNVGTTPYGLGDFLINEEKFLYPKAFDKKLKITSGGAFSKLSIFLNTFGTEYGFVFNEYSMTSHHDSQKHITFDFGKLSFGSVSKKFPQFFGAKFRYEYGFSGQDSHRFGIEGYWHPTFFNIRGWRYDNKRALNYKYLRIYRIHKYA